MQKRDWHCQRETNYFCLDPCFVLYHKLIQTVDNEIKELDTKEKLNRQKHKDTNIKTRDTKLLCLLSHALCLCVFLSHCSICCWLFGGLCFYRLWSCVLLCACSVSLSMLVCASYGILLTLIRSTYQALQMKIIYIFYLCDTAAVIMLINMHCAFIK